MKKIIVHSEYPNQTEQDINRYCLYLGSMSKELASTLLADGFAEIKTSDGKVTTYKIEPMEQPS